MPREKRLNAMSERKQRRERKQSMQHTPNSLGSKRDNRPTIDISHDHPVIVLKSAKIDPDDDIPLKQVKRHINTNDDILSKRRKPEQALYIKPEENSPYPPPQCIKSEDITAVSYPEVNDNFIIYEINEVNSSNDLNTDSDKVSNSLASEISVAQCSPPAPHPENLITVWTYSKTNRPQNATTLKKCTTNATMPNRIITKINNCLEISATSSLKQKATSGRKVASIKIHGTPIKKVITSYSEVANKCACRRNPMKNVDMHSKLELKDFFERMFEETRKLTMERRQMVKTELLKAVSQAEEDVEAGKFCEKCYTMLAQPKKRY